MSVLKKKKAIEESGGLVLPKQYRISQPQPHALLTPDHFRVSQPLPQRMPVKDFRRWFDVNKGMKINRSTLCVWISAYKRGSYFSQKYRNLHNPSTVQDLTNGAQGE